jgi:hypothetical protein
MGELTFKKIIPSDIFLHFAEDKVLNRYQALFDGMAAFLAVNELQGNAYVNKHILVEAIVGYFYDIKRLKDFHPDIEVTNSEKVIAYTSFWLLSRKPIQVKDDVVSEGSPKFMHINERFALQYILDYLSVRERNKQHILLRNETGIKNFAKYLFYHLVYDLQSPKGLEMLIIAFWSGQMYENTDEDLSKVLHPYDN